MDDQMKLRLDNAQWQQDHKRWQREIEDWRQETQRLVALVYLLEKTLPDHSSKLERHKGRIDKHNDELNSYRCGLETQCLPACPSRIETEKLKQLHYRVEHHHRDMRNEHESLSEAHHNKMRRFRELAERLICELEELV